MKYRTLGKTGLEVSVIGIGTWQFGGEWGKDFSQEEVDAVMDAGRETGINLVDTAECYGDHLSERLVGKAIARDRDKWIVATKFGHHFKGLFERDFLYGADEVRKQLEESLSVLGVDHIDLYQFHSGDNEAFDNDELWTMLDKQREAGKIGHIGLSLRQSVQDYQAERASAVGAEAIQVIYNRIDLAAEPVVIPACKKQNLGILARVPLASGFLSGKYTSGASFPKNDHRSRKEREEIERALAEVERIRREEVPNGTDMAAWALAWCLKDRAVSCVIPGCKNAQQVRSNAAAADLEMVA